LELFILLFLLIVIYFVLTFLRTKHIIGKLVKLFNNASAIDYNSAKTLEEIGIRQQSFVERLYKIPDHRYRILHHLVAKNVVKTTEDNRYYLSFEELNKHFGNDIPEDVQ